MNARPTVRRRPGPTRPLVEAAALLLLCLAVYLPGLVSTPPIDRDEARFAQASRQMFEALALPAEVRHTRPITVDPETGDVRGGFHAGGWAVPMVQNIPRLNKPPVIYWLQTTSAWALTLGEPLDDAIWMYRVPSVLGSIIAVFATWRLGRMLFHPSVAWLGAAMLAVSAVVIFDAHQARADQVLLGVTTVSMWLLWKAIARGRCSFGPWLLLWLAVGVGVLVKGLSPVVVLLTLVAFCALRGDWRAWRSAKPLLGILIVAAVVAPWALAVIRHVGFETYTAILFDETVRRGQQAKEGHAGPPGYHVSFLIAAFWPGSLFVAAGLWRGFRSAIRFGPSGARWSGRVTQRHGELFLIAWILPTWLFFEVYSTKLPHYVLPTYPAIALLTARAALSARRWVPTLIARANAVLFAIVGLAVAGGATYTLTLDLSSPPSAVLLVTLAVVLVLATLSAGWRAWLGDTRRALVASGIAVLSLAWAAHGLVLPAMTGFSPRLLAEIQTLDDGTRPLGCAGYHEDSLIFLTRGRIQRLPHLEASGWLRDHPEGLLLFRVGDRPEDEDPFRVVGALTGYHFANGRMTTVEFLEHSDAD
ncbi:MAG: glycosyltransferase family 39 protein [Planctomycetota bacterium]